MTDVEQAKLLLIAGLVAVLIGIGLALAKIDPDELRRKSRTNPGMALYRFAAYQWSVVAILIGSGILMSAYGWLSIRAI